jgi:hypothetical protein
MQILAELTPLNASSGSRVTLRAASADDRRITGLNGVEWWPAILEASPLGINLFDGDFSSDIDVGAMSLTVLTDKLARLDTAARGYRWPGAGVKIYAGNAGDTWPWTQWLEGKVDGFDAEANRLRLRIKVNTEPFDTNVLTSSYAGTGGAEGGSDLKNKVKPWLFGRALNVEPVLIDATNSVYQFSAYGPIQAVGALYERASDFGAAVGDYASYAALVAATIPAGRWGTCLAAGMIRLGAPAYGVITGDVDGDKPSGTWIRKTGAIINRIAANAGISSGLIDSASLAALDTAVPYNINLYLDEQATVIEVARRLARPCNAQVGISWLGKMFATRVSIAGTAAVTLDAQGRQKPGVLSSVESDVSPPYWRVEFGAQRSWRVHSFDEIASAATLIDRGRYDAATIYREGNIVDLDDGSRWEYVATTPTAGNDPILGSLFWSELSPGSGAGGALPGQILRDDKFVSSFWTIPLPAARVAWAGSRSAYAVTIPFVASTDFRITYDPTASTALPRTTAGKTMYARVLLDPSGFSGVQVVDDDGTPIVDDDGVYVVDADPADFDLEVAIVWQNADGSFNSRSTIATVDPDDGVQTVEGNAIAPVTGFAVLELGYPSQTGKTGAWTAYEPWLAEYEPTADVTAQAQVSVELTPLRSYEADYLGVIGTGLPDTVSPRVTRGGASIKTDDATSYEITPSSGITATRDNTTGSATKGDISITAVDTLDGWIDLAVSVGGVAQPTKRMSVRKSLGSAPSGGGSGSKRASTGSFTDVTTTSYARIAFVGTVTVASGESLYANASLDYYIGGSGGFRTGSVKLRYAPTGTTSWTDIGAAATGSGATGYTTPEGFFEPANPGHVDYAQSATPSAATYDVEIVALESSTGRTMTFAGVAAVEAKV